MSKQKLESMSLRQRIIWLTSGAVFIIGLLLVIFVNLIAPIFITREVGSPDTQILINTVDAMVIPLLSWLKLQGRLGIRSGTTPVFQEQIHYLLFEFYQG